MIGRGLCVLGCFVLVGCGASPQGELGVDETLGSSGQAVQLEWHPQGFGNVNFVQTAPMNGALRMMETVTVNGQAMTQHVSCGVTFISPRLALTAAHCVRAGRIPTPSNARVEQYNATNTNILQLINQSFVSGTWPNYTRAPLSASQYQVTSFSGCVPVVGCHSTHLDLNCPLSRRDVDIALIRCPTRPSNAPYVQVHPNDRSNAEVTVEWFHEVVELNPDPNHTVSGPADNWAHYGRAPTSPDPNQDIRVDNWHYRFGGHQLLPLESSTWAPPPGSNGTNLPRYRQIGHDVLNETSDANPDVLTRTDVPVCHGTSGSGVFERGTTGVFGVVALWARDTRIGNFYGNAEATERRLCEDITAATDGKTVSPGQRLMRHTRRSFAAQLEALPIVQQDRAQ